MQFDWTAAKAAANLTKHKVSFELAVEVWKDPLLVILYDRFEDDEDRWHAVGAVRDIILLVVHTYPDPGDEQSVRIISARKATPNERYRYENFF